MHHHGSARHEPGSMYLKYFRRNLSLVRFISTIRDMFGEKYVFLLNFKIYNTQPVVFTAQPLRTVRGVCLDRRDCAVTLLFRACFERNYRGRGGIENIVCHHRGILGCLDKQQALLVVHYMFKIASMQLPRPLKFDTIRYNSIKFDTILSCMYSTVY